MSTCTSSNPFESAASYLSNSPALSNVSNDVKLELYALYKCITVSPRPQTSRPSLFDFAGRAKWDAWDKLGRESPHSDPEIWKTRYLEIARSLGWKGDAVASDKTDSSKHDDSSSLSDPSSDRGSGEGGGGMGITVSTMSKPVESASAEDNEIPHGFAISGDAEGLKHFLEIRSDVDLNSLDSYGYTPLHLAADRGNEEVMKVLLEKGADPAIQDADEFTPLQLAEIAGHDNIVSMLRAHVQ